MITASGPTAAVQDPAGVVARAAPPPDRGGRVVDMPKPAAPPPPPERVKFDPEKMMANIKEAVEHLNKQMSSSGRSLGFAMDEVMRMPVVTVKDTRSGEVIRQIPSETVVRVAHVLDDLKGLLYDQST